MTEKALSKRLKLALDELRMQTMGTQILFGFQLQSLFQPGFDHAGYSERIADAGALCTTVLSFAILIVAPARHRLAESWDASRDLLKLTGRCAELALGTIAAALGCIAFAITTHLDVPGKGIIAALVTGLALAMWFGAGLLWKRPLSTSDVPELEKLDLHTKIDQMLTEARVILPGVQALMGFQLIVVMTEAFGRLPESYRYVHLIGLVLTALCVALLLMPAAIHRIAFSGEDDSRFHTIGSAMVSAALVPLALAISAEMFIGAWRLSENFLIALVASILSLTILLAGWYVYPLVLKSRRLHPLDE